METKEDAVAITAEAIAAVVTKKDAVVIAAEAMVAVAVAVVAAVAAVAMVAAVAVNPSINITIIDKRLRRGLQAATSTTALCTLRR